MSTQHRAQDFLFAVRNLGLYSFVFFLLTWPLLSVFWEFAQDLLPHWTASFSLLGCFLSGLDVGGQSELSRSLLRVLLSAACVAGLLLPLASPEPAKPKWLSVPWGPLFLLVGLLSVVLSEQLFVAETEWETLALILLLAGLLRRAHLGALPQLSLISLYLVTFGVILHAILVASPTSTGRLGGVFFHSNALSTFCLLCLPFLIWRSLAATLEGGLASFLSAGLLAVLVGTGSLTGACLLTGALTFWALRSHSRLQWLLTPLAAAAPLLINLLEWSAILFPVLLLGLLVGVFLSRRAFMPTSNQVIFWLSLMCVLGGLQLVQYRSSTQGLVPSRGNSGAARIEFYRAGLSMVSERPILGHGPRGFSRQFPSRQKSVRFYSKFVHCVPLEFLLEWGGLAFVLAALWLATTWRTSYDSPVPGGAAAFRWSLALLLLHSFTGVQTQFPYLLLLVALSWAAAVPAKTESQPAQSFGVAVVRASLALVLLGFFLLNCWRVSAHYSRLLALDLHQRIGARARPAVRQLFASSTELLPTCGKTWLLWSQVERQLGDPEQGAILAEMSRRWDTTWAIPFPYIVFTGQQRRDPETWSTALRLDPVNYPQFHLWQAESMLRSGEAEPLQLLRKRSQDYSLQVLSALPKFRADDLREQLGEFFLLLAILEEREGRLEESERAFRLALYHCDRRLSRLDRMLRYPKLTGIEPGPLVKDLLVQLFDQVPAKDGPGTIQVPTD